MKLKSSILKRSFESCTGFSPRIFKYHYFWWHHISNPFVTQTGEASGLLTGIFTATSAVCVTGLVVVDTGTHWNMAGQIVIMLLIQIGGLGIMTMATSVALIVGRKITLKSRLIMQEALNQFTLQGVVRLTRYIIFMTLFIEALGAIFLSIRFLDYYDMKTAIFYGIFHSISAFCNAGFDLIGHGRSLTPFVEDTTLSVIVMSLIVLGGLGFTVIMDVLRFKRFKTYTLHTKIVVIMTTVLLLTGFIFSLQWSTIILTP